MIKILDKLFINYPDLAFEFVCSFFLSPKEFKKKNEEWKKPVPNWMSATMWIIFLGFIIFAIIK